MPTSDVRACIRQAATRVREGRRIPFVVYPLLAEWMDGVASKLDMIADAGADLAVYVDERLVYLADGIERASTAREEYEAAERAADPTEDHRAALAEILDMAPDSSWPDIVNDVRDQWQQMWRRYRECTCTPGTTPAPDIPAPERPPIWPAGQARPVLKATTTGTGRGAATDWHTGWDCPNGASLLACVTGPGRGTLPAHHGVIYVCPNHQAEADARITAAGYQPDTDPAPPGHRWDPWPCGHITTYGPGGPQLVAALALTAPATATDGDPCD